jgi:Tfp pilus assembly protein PilO
MNAKRQELLLTIGLVVLAVVVALAGLALAVLPQHTKASKLNTDIANAQTRLVSLHATPSRVPVIPASDLFSIARAMPNTTDMPGILLDLSRAAAATGVGIQSITPAVSVIQPDGSSAIPISLSVTGKWPSIAAFLRRLRLQVRVDGDKLRVGGRLFVVDNVQLTASTASTNVVATLALNAFVYGEVQVVTTSTDTTQTTTTTSSSGSVQAAGATG